MIGEKHNKLTIIEDYGMVKLPTRKRKTHKVNTLCECGNKRVVDLEQIRNGRAKSCGCWRTGKHNLTNHPLFRVWGGIKGRCSERDKNNRKDYFDRGIKVCDEWQTDFMSFYTWANANGWTKGLHIDRIDNDKGYSPDNCRFVTPRDNCNNRSNTLFLELRGKKKPLTEWAAERGIETETLRRRIFNYGWSIERALSTKTRGYAA